MIIEIRLYKSHDTDLVALCNAGYCISNMLKEAIIGYANGTPIHFIVDEFVPFEVSGTKSVRTRFTMPDEEQKACYILKNVKKGYRNSFCKAVLRNALIQQNLNCYFTDANLMQLQSINLQYKNVYSLTNVIPCSSMKLSEKQIEFLGRKVKRERPKPVKNTYANSFTDGNPFLNMGVGYLNPAQPPKNQGATKGKAENIYAASPIINSRPVMPPTQPMPTEIWPQPTEELVSVTESPISSTTPPVVNIKELASKTAVASTSPPPTNNKEETHIISATESQDDVSIGVADDDELLKIFDAL